MEREGFAFPIEVDYEWLPDFCSHCQILGHSVVNCRWLHPEKDLNLDKDNTKKVQDKGKKVVTQQKSQTKKWKARENPFGIRLYLAFEKLVVNSEVTTTVTTLEQSLDQQHVSPTVIVPFDTQIAQVQWWSQDYCKAWAKKICNTFIGVYIRNCKQIIKKSEEIVQFIGVYIRNS